MRTTCQIQIAVQEADPDITDEELRLCIEAQRNIEHFYRRDILDLIEAIRGDINPAILKMKAEAAWKSHERLWEAAKKPPAEWLGPNNIPGSPEQKRRLAWAKRAGTEDGGSNASP